MDKRHNPRDHFDTAANPDPDWTRQRREQPDFCCGWCAHFLPDAPQEADGDEVSPLGKCCACPPVPLVVRGNVPDHFLGTKHFAVVDDVVADISVGERIKPHEPEKHLYAVPYRPTVRRWDTGCRNFRSCFRKTEGGAR